MRQKFSYWIGGLMILATAGVTGCGSNDKEPDNPLFTVLGSSKTGLTFSNDLSYSQSFNLFKYIYFYNGSGVGAGDFNNDGLCDLFFGSNQGNNKLYLNTGNLAFKEAGNAAGIPADNGWTTGISVVDINHDGKLDIYVCRVGDFEVLHSRNQLLINQGPDKNGVPVFVDKAKEYGLDFSGFSTQAAFFDYDLDGDLDMFLMNHSVHQNGTFKPRQEFAGSYHPRSGDRFFRNDNDHFTDVTRETGINSSAIGYGLGIAIADINLDGYPDIYIGNDFHENDYLYINQRNGTFTEIGQDAMMHTSQYSMGVDVADVTNDGFPEIISMDMLPEDPYILKRSLGEDAYDIFVNKIGMGYAYQYTRNNLQYNRGDGLFSETGLFSGIAATDWSWAPLWMDFDNDGFKDLFISNGIPKRMNDIDYVNFVSNTPEVQLRINMDSGGGKDLSLIKKFPEIKIPNKFYHNQGGLVFSDVSEQVAGTEPTFSNGAIYADLDNDGDLDIVVNNVDAPVTLYRNNAAGKTGSHAVELTMKGPTANPRATGARVVIFSAGQIRTQEQYPVRGFMSSMETPMLVPLPGGRADSAFFVWPDNSYQRLSFDSAQKKMTVTYQEGLPQFDYTIILQSQPAATFTASDITEKSGLTFHHKENHFVEFDREPLVPHMLSTEGPAVAVADINGDKLDDIFLGAARYGKAVVYQQRSGGRFEKMNQPALDADSAFEDVDAVWADINKDGFADLLVASGGNEFYGKDFHNTPRLYLNDGKGQLTRVANVFDTLYGTASCISISDINNDGYPDVFLGGRTVPWGYGQVPQSRLLLNNKDNTFTDVTNQYADDLNQAGLVTGAEWVDIDKDGDTDLLLSLEWGPLTAYLREGNRFVRKAISPQSGWWNFAKTVDIDNDGDLDIVAGNLGLNSRLKATTEKPVHLYYNDFDGNGRGEQVVTYHLGGKEIPFANKAELEKQLPLLKKKFLYAADFAKAGLNDLFGKDKLESSRIYTADYFANAIFINKGNGQFEVMAFPFEAQLTSYRDAVFTDVNADGRTDILLGGNYYDNNIEMGRYDADYGTILLNRGNNRFEVSKLPGLAVKGQVRHIRTVRIENSEVFVFAKNNDSTRLIRFEKR